MTTPPKYNLPGANDPDQAEDPFQEFEEEGSSYSFRELMNLLTDKRDIILTIPTAEIPALKKGLYNRKAADTQKLTKAGILPSNEVLSFLTYPSVDEMGKERVGESCVRIRLAARKSVTILSIEVPDDTL